MMTEENIPNLQLTQYGYEGGITLNKWNELMNSKVDNVIDLSVNVDEEDPEIHEEQIRAYNYLIDNQEQIINAILSCLYDRYPEIKGADENGEEGEEYLPEVKDISDLKPLIELYHVHIIDVFKNGIAYIGYEFNCTWDEEHGLGVMMFKDRIVDIGGSDTAILSWIAEADLEEKNS